MKKSTLALTVAALAFGTAAAGVVYAQQTGAMPAMHGMMHDPWGDATITRADAQAKAAAKFDRMDLNHDGKLDSADRAIRIGEHFDKMDANHDGMLSKQEFIAAHEQAMASHEGRGGPDHDRMGGCMMAHRMMGMDANGDHAITRDEFLAGALRRFDAADANHDGKLTKEERRAAMHGMMQGRGEGMRGGMDHDGHAGGHD